MQTRAVSVVLVLIVSLCAVVRADAQSDASRLRDEADQILRKNAVAAVSPEEYAQCIFKLEQAQAILDKANDSDSGLAQEINSKLYWARKASDVHILKVLERLRAGAGTTPPPAPARKIEPVKPQPPVAKQPDQADEPPAPDPAIAAAKKAFDAAQSYANSNSADDFSVALRWFQMADQHAGTDYALKALGLARAAQERFAAKNAAKKEELPDTPEMKLVREGDVLVEQNKYEQAIALYKGSLAQKETIIAHRRLGKTYFKRAQQMKDELMPQFDQADQEYRAAWQEATIWVRSARGSFRRVNQNHPSLVAAKNKIQTLSKKAYEALAIYDTASSEFKAVLRMADGGKDLDAAGHIGLCMSVRGDALVRSRAKQYLQQFLNEYKPANDLERSLYEFCKTELQRLVSVR